jgi:hypothetical protein
VFFKRNENSSRLNTVEEKEYDEVLTDVIMINKNSKDRLLLPSASTNLFSETFFCNLQECFINLIVITVVFTIPRLFIAVQQSC